MMTQAELKENREHYTIHSITTVILNYTDQRQHFVLLYGKRVTAEDQTVHLGIPKVYSLDGCEDKSWTQDHKLTDGSWVLR